jgi:hypothetical protein
MELLKNFDIDVSNKIKLNNMKYVAHYFKHTDSNIKYNSNTNSKYESYDDMELYLQSQLSDNNKKMMRTTNTLNNINLTDNIDLVLNKLTIGCNYLFHDDKWLKFYKDNFICSLNDDIKYIYCNSINMEDVHDMNLLQFIKKLQELDLTVKLIKFDENDEDMEEEYENTNVTWFVIMVKK